jgi:septal ring factor EnvC (AmiA/AmiB activator)
MSEETTQNLPNDVSRLILARLDSIDRRLDSMDQRLDSMDQRLEKLEVRAYDTKPIWERALAELVELSKRMDSLDRRFHVLSDDVIQNRADFRKYDQRLADLEQPPRA